MPGHRTCYYSDSGAQHVAGGFGHLDAAAAAAGAGSGAPAVALQQRTIKCSICGNDVLGIITLRHNSLCGLLATELGKLRGAGVTADARLTVLANWAEEQLMHEVWPEGLYKPLQQVIDVARLAASLQPDGTGMPEYRCTEAINILHCLHQHWWHQMQMLTATASNPEVLAEGAADCDIVVTLCLRIIKHMEDKLRWLTEPLPGARTSAASGTSTPRPTPVMQVTDFEMICPISRGAYGRVYKVKKKSTGDTFAIKVLTKTELVRKNMVESVTNERNILAMANNPIVVRFYYSFSSPEKLFLVMEYCPGGDLSSLLQHLGRFDEDVARQYIAETVLALEYCHSKGIIHRDLKPDNLLISNTGHIKLSDFGLSKFGGAAAAAEGATAAAAAAAAAAATEPPPPSGSSSSSAKASASAAAAQLAHQLQQERQEDAAAEEQQQQQQQWLHGGSSMPQAAEAAAVAEAAASKPKLKHASQPTHRALGTPDYLAPERLMGMAYGPEVDWWALGVILYEFVYGAPPFNADTPQEIFERILDCNVEFILDEEGQHVVSQECRDLISSLLQGDPEKRLGHRGAGEVKLHPWFQGIEWGSLARQKAAFIPSDTPDAASYFVEKPFSKLSIAADLNPNPAGSDRDADVAQQQQQQQRAGSSSGAAAAAAAAAAIASPAGVLV
ncbi:hypothetical protein OEZ86_007187 [Tetradesmus obliquus]|nr:hypothetical protein OEZ86_007187 [Tetradesmus obliquus]